jgi:tRNA pseudouridine55 synthase
MPIISIHKPVGITSHDVVSVVRRISSIKRVGHAGTLDPLASGVLVVGIGRDSTRQLHTSMESDKEYEALVQLGAYSSTDDAEGEKVTVEHKQKPTITEVESVLPEFVGDIVQMPPLYSAVKVGGREAYKYARQGKQLTLGGRSVTIYEIELVDYQYPQLTLRVRCGSGVYIRSLARDLGKRLETGGYLAGLVRTRVGAYTLDQAMTLEEFKRWWQHDKQVL